MLVMLSSWAPLSYTPDFASCACIDVLYQQLGMTLVSVVPWQDL